MRFIALREVEQQQEGRFEALFRHATTNGLGLYIMQRCAEMMNGKVGFSSEVEKGSEFWVELTI
ncbi:MAG: hypothetical protein OHK0019_05880 [Saprospiraceae bacterium]